MQRVEISSWAEFCAAVAQDPSFALGEEARPKTYWRGQRDPEWPLASSFERTILDGIVPDKESKVYPYGWRLLEDGKPLLQAHTYLAMRNDYLERFKRAAVGLRGPSPMKLDDDQWWALGRHYGLITPLLDWTEKPYLAAFFAIIDQMEAMQREGGGSIALGGRRTAVYRLADDGTLPRQGLLEGPGASGHGLRFLSELLIDELPRMHRQRSVFTWLESNRYFELQGLLEDIGKGDLLTQFLLSEQAVLDGLRDLDRRGVDYLTLYPDLEGAARHANFHLPF